MDEAAGPDQLDYVRLFLESCSSLLHRNLLPLVVAADHFARQKSHKEFFNALAHRMSRLCNLVGFEELWNQVVVQLFVIQDAEQYWYGCEQGAL